MTADKVTVLLYEMSHTLSSHGALVSLRSPVKTSAFLYACIERSTKPLLEICLEKIFTNNEQHFFSTRIQANFADLVRTFTL